MTHKMICFQMMLPWGVGWYKRNLAQQEVSLTDYGAESGHLESRLDGCLWNLKENTEWWWLQKFWFYSSGGVEGGGGPPLQCTGGWVLSQLASFMTFNQFFPSNLDKTHDKGLKVWEGQDDTVPCSMHPITHTLFPWVLHGSAAPMFPMFYTP